MSKSPRALFIIVLSSSLLTLCGCASDGPTERPYRIEHDYSIADPAFPRTMANLLGPPLVAGNSVTTLVNGDQIFPPMLAAIRGAKQTIEFETYIYWSGKVGGEFSDALAERAANGVKVHVILDSIGSGKIDRHYVAKMKDAGVQLIDYHPLHWYDIAWTKKVNNRTHRKLLIVDGRVGFTGGVGIADEWLGNAESPDHWRDTHYMISGPIVGQLEAAFADNWMETTGHVLDGDLYFPKLQNSGRQWTQVFKSSPQGGSESMELMYLLSMAAAEKNIRLASAYFVPDRLTTETLLDARKRGVTVQIIVPGRHIDIEIVRDASRARWGELLAAGVRIYEYQPTMYHCKQMIVDDKWVSIGSANLDARSFRLNDETNLNVLDEDFAQQQIHIFDEDLRHARQITYQMWRHRPLLEKMGESFASAFGWLM